MTGSAPPPGLLPVGEARGRSTSHGPASASFSDPCQGPAETDHAPPGERGRLGDDDEVIHHEESPSFDAEAPFPVLAGHQGEVGAEPGDGTVGADRGFQGVAEHLLVELGNQGTLVGAGVAEVRVGAGPFGDIGGQPDGLREAGAAKKKAVSGPVAGVAGPPPRRIGEKGSGRIPRGEPDGTAPFRGRVWRRSAPAGRGGIQNEGLGSSPRLDPWTFQKEPAPELGPCGRHPGTWDPPSQGPSLRVSSKPEFTKAEGPSTSRGVGSTPAEMRARHTRQGFRQTMGATGKSPSPAGQPRDDGNVGVKLDGRRRRPRQSVRVGTGARGAHGRGAPGRGCLRTASAFRTRPVPAEESVSPTPPGPPRPVARPAGTENSRRQGAPRAPGGPFTSG